MANEANFSGQPETKWLTQPNIADRNMELLKGFSYRDWKGVAWNAPQGTVVDGATIPRALWSLVGSPYSGDYRRASIVHDVACIGANAQQRRAADKMFYQACRDGGCSISQAMILYVGVRIGAWFSASVMPQWMSPSLSLEGLAKSGPRAVKSREDERMERDFSIIAEATLRQGETDDVDELERRVDHIATMVSGVANLSALA
ncbi:MAG: DUF1353 domain-containing protein [Hyphomonadaceae bacterium]|nr:DUF1353 domain-containing protein [Hyphomonadaceae bacterium]